MRPPKINDHKLLRLIDRQGMNQTEAAKALCVSRQAVSRRLQEIRGKTTKVIVAKKIEQVIDRKIDAIDQLNRINVYTNEILDLAMAWSRGNDEIEVSEFKFKDPREIALRACGEIRSQIRLQFEILQALYSIKEAEKFQKTVLEVLTEASPEIRMEVVRKLRAKSPVRAALRYS